MDLSLIGMSTDNNTIFILLSLFVLLLAGMYRSAAA